jgi:hypothetical protein
MKLQYRTTPLYDIKCLPHGRYDIENIPISWSLGGEVFHYKRVVVSDYTFKFEREWFHGTLFRSQLKNTYKHLDGLCVNILGSRR